jgi:DNA primase
MRKRDKVLYLNGEFDVLSYYSKIAPVLLNFLKNKEIASKIHLEDLFFLKRGSKNKPLYINDFSVVDKEMLNLRKNHLKDIRNKLNEKQALIWDYFVPRKIVQFFYATNGEGIGKPIERIFIDIDTGQNKDFILSHQVQNKLKQRLDDRRKHTADDARIIAFNLVKLIKEDDEFNKLVVVRKIIVLWTGASFHVYLLLKKNIDLKFYNKYLSYGPGKNKSDSFIMKWAREIEKEVNISVRAGHEKSDKSIILDSSNTPSGKLARAPFSLHVKNWKNIDGVCVPVSFSELEDKNIIKRLKSLMPDDVIRKLKKYGRLI